MDRAARSPRDRRELGEVVAYSLFFNEPIIFNDPEGKLGQEECGGEVLAPMMPAPVEK